MISKLKLSSKCISPVVATSLLLVVAVSSVVFFQGWFSDFSSSVLVDIESDSSSSSSAVRVEGVINDVLYLNSKSKDELTLLSVTDSQGVELCSFLGGDNISSSGLVEHWDFDNSNNGIILDKSVNSNHGDLYGNSRLILNFDDGIANDLTAYNNSGVVNGATYNSSCGLNGGCFEFDGIDDFINLSSTNLGLNNQSFTISLWFKSNSNGSRRMHVFSYAEHSTSNFDIDIDDPYAPGYGMWVYWNGGGTPRVWQPGLGIYTKNDWQNIIVTKDSNLIKLYMNGNFIGDEISQNIKFTGGNIYLGTRNQDYFFNGSIDEVGIYSKALSENEISDLYNSKKAKFVEFKNSKLDSKLEFDGNIYNKVVIDNQAQFLNNSEFISVIYSGVIREKSFTLPNVGSIWKTHITGGNWGVFVGVNENDLFLTSRSVALDNQEKTLFENIIPLNVFVNLITIFDYKNQKIKVFVNGEKKGEVPTINWSSNRYISNGGGLDNLGYSSGFDYINADYDDLQIYNRDFTDLEIKQLYFNYMKSQSVGINKIDLSSCNLSKGQKYNILGFTDKNKIDVEVIVK